MIALCFLLLWKPTPTAKDPLSLDNYAVHWKGNQYLPQAQQQDTGIAIPGFKSLIFRANQTEQKVNFYNPESNEGIVFKETLYVNDTVYWSSGYVPAGEGYYNIGLSEPIPAGDYQAYLQIDCYKETGEQLNGAKIEFELTVQ